MKNLSMLAGLAFAFIACQPSIEKSQSENVELVKNYVTAVENLDFEAMGNYLDADYVGFGPSFGDTIYKVEAIENWKINVDNLYESIHYNRVKMAPVSIADGNNKGEWVGVWAELTIVYKNDGGEVTIWAHSDYLVENGKIKRSFTFYNEADALRQLGYITVPADESL